MHPQQRTTTPGGFAASRTGSKEEQRLAKSLPRWLYPSVDLPSATQGVWQYHCWLPPLWWLSAQATAARWCPAAVPCRPLSQCPPPPWSHHCKGKPRDTLLQKKDKRHLPEPIQCLSFLHQLWTLDLWNEPRGLAACFLWYHKSPQGQHHGKLWWGRIFVIRVEIGI